MALEMRRSASAEGSMASNSHAPVVSPWLAVLLEREQMQVSTGGVRLNRARVARSPPLILPPPKSKKFGGENLSR